jgi:Tfp pilus assembly PilM family ATPase
MLKLFSSPCIGIEITSRSLKLGAPKFNGSSPVQPITRVLPLPEGMVVEAYPSENIKDPEGLSALLRGALEDFASLRTRRVGLSLADSVFRVQTIDLDELPGRAADRDRLVRWRVEKSAAFDASDTELRYQVQERPGRGYSVLTCLAKRDVIAQYETLIGGLGYDPWFVGPASFHALNYFYPSLLQQGFPVFAFAWITESSYSTLIVEGGAPRFYRSKEIRQGATGDASGRILRELNDSLHFYSHLDRLQHSDVSRLFLAGNTTMLQKLVDELKLSLSLEIEVLSPDSLYPSDGMPHSFASVLGSTA